MSCVLFKKMENDCNLVFKYFGKFNLLFDLLYCWNVLSWLICIFFMELWFVLIDWVLVKCWRDVCSKFLFIFFGCLDLEFGVMKNENSWLRFVNVGELEDELFIIVL